MKIADSLNQIIKDTTASSLKNFIGYTALIISIFGFGFAKETAAMGIGVAGSAIFLVFANVDKFVRFKGAGFEAEMREFVSDANATVDNLRSVATPLISSYITNLSNEGMLFSVDTESKRKRYEEILELQIELGINHPSINKAKRQFLTLQSRQAVLDLARKLDPTEEEDDSSKHNYLELHSKLNNELGDWVADENPDLNKAEELLYKEYDGELDRKTIDAALQYARNALEAKDNLVV